LKEILKSPETIKRKMKNELSTKCSLQKFLLSNIPSSLSSANNAKSTLFCMLVKVHKSAIGINEIVSQGKVFSIKRTLCLVIVSGHDYHATYKNIFLIAP